MNKEPANLNMLLSKEHRSIRTSFKISKETAYLFEVQTSGTQVTVKKLFELAFEVEKMFGSSGVESIIEDESARSMRKTFVVSPGIIKKINVLTKKYNFSSRDETVAFLARLIAANLASIREADILESILNELDVSDTMLNDIAVEQLGPEHPVTKRLSYISTITWALYHAIENFLEKGTPIDPDNFSQGCREE